jgi:SAM-dependent methyltransferase
LTSSPAPRADTVGSGVEELFLARTAPFAFHGARLRFDLATTVFSSAGVDPGSALLLRHLQTIEHPPAGRVLDLGCGHGVLGLTLLAIDPARRLVLVDRDALALRYTARNLRRNELPAGQTWIGGSLGYDDVPRPEGAGPFDLIVSNLPGKAGEAVIAELATAAEPWSGPGTVVAVVVVAPLASLVRELLAPPRFEVLVDGGNKTHQVLISRRVAAGRPAPEPPMSGFARGLYDRNQTWFRSGDLEWEATAVVGLDEFDNLAYGTKLLRAALRGVRAGPCTVVEPGQGHRAVIAARSGQQVETLLSRDLLALRATARALDGLGPPPALVHDLALPEGLAPMTIIHGDDKVHAPWLAQQVSTVIERSRAARGTGLSGTGVAKRPGGPQLVLSGRPSLLGRIEADLLARSGARLAFKLNRNGARVVRYQFPG